MCSKQHTRVYECSRRCKDLPAPFSAGATGATAATGKRPHPPTEALSGVDIEGAVDEHETCEPEVPVAPPSSPAPEWAFPDMIKSARCVGVLHLCLMGLLACILKLYYGSLLHHCAHTVLARRAVQSAEL